MKKTRMRYMGFLLLLLVGLAGCHTKGIQTDDQAADQTIALTHLAIRPLTKAQPKLSPLMLPIKTSWSSMPIQGISTCSQPNR